MHEQALKLDIKNVLTSINNIDINTLELLQRV